ncbi:hypothetical protein [Chitinimonas sp.]|uniref:hypothetical protein n=1 Tax=Chitinimonas sp. TaxID=1934313 RepID=UPI0035B4587C
MNNTVTTLSSLAAALSQLSTALSQPPASPAGSLPAASPAPARLADQEQSQDLVTLGGGDDAPLTYNARGKLNVSPALKALLAEAAPAAGTGATSLVQTAQQLLNQGLAGRGGNAQLAAALQGAPGLQAQLRHLAASRPGSIDIQE